MGKRLITSLISLKQLSERIKNGDISPVDLVEVCFDRIKKFNPTLNAFISIIEKDALYKQAQMAETEIKRGKYLGPLHGIPFSIKDIFCVKGIRCTAGSMILSKYIADADSTAVKRMKKAGAILIGTNNLNEFACGITGINPFYGSSKNPWDSSRISGGSSGGSAVAVATGMAIISLGTDTGGSIRVPSSLCGVVGLKPTYGVISKHNVFPLSPSLDHVGCISRSVWDTATVMGCIAGWNLFRNATSFNKKVAGLTKTIEEFPIKGIRIGIPKKYFCDSLHPEIADKFYVFLETFRSMGCILSDLDLQNTEKYHDSWSNIRLAEAAEIHLKWLKTRPKDYSNEVREMLIQGTEVSAVDYLLSKRIIRDDIRVEFLSILKHSADVIVVPTSIIPAPLFNERTVRTCSKTILQTREALLRNNIVFNSTGLPAVSIPIGFTRNGLPIGGQIIGPPLKENLILSVAYSFECKNNSVNKFTPSICHNQKYN
jgi:aspartyl-tRNA(Asn)/glutamyl-tRNA(Gln) amidotransferase subunit A